VSSFCPSHGPCLYRCQTSNKRPYDPRKLRVAYLRRRRGSRSCRYKSEPWPPLPDRALPAEVAWPLRGGHTAARYRATAAHPIIGRTHGLSAAFPRAWAKMRLRLLCGARGCDGLSCQTITQAPRRDRSPFPGALFFSCICTANQTVTMSLVTSRRCCGAEAAGARWNRRRLMACATAKSRPFSALRTGCGP